MKSVSECVCIYEDRHSLLCCWGGCKSEKLWTDAWNLYAVSAKCETSITLLLLSLTWVRLSLECEILKKKFHILITEKKCFCGYVSIMRKVFLKFHMRNENFTQLTKVISYKVHFIAEHHYHHHRRRLFCLHLTILWGLLRAAAVATECYDEMESY